MIDRARLKYEAKGVLRNARVSPYVVSLIMLIVGAVANFIIRYADNYFADLEIILGKMVTTEYGHLIPYIPTFPDFLKHNEFPTLTVYFVMILATLLLVVLNGGWTLYNLGVRNGKFMSYGTLLDGFTFAGKLIGLYILMVIKIALWSMLFYIPGIVAAYRYQFAIYNLCENPDIKITEAIEMSKMQTYGYKGALFVLDLSFLGWYILNVLTRGIAGIWITPYIQQTKLGYFYAIKEIKGLDGQKKLDC